ncbi:MAG: hypothetical protein INQ03_09680 [Candidatus Heimdallarchaeota archaeon]|nr:hypothetical protein [Candidatus Heimdallarchaeota archaeon]
MNDLVIFQEINSHSLPDKVQYQLLEIMSKLASSPPTIIEPQRSKDIGIINTICPICKKQVSEDPVICETCMQYYHQDHLRIYLHYRDLQGQLLD